MAILNFDRVLNYAVRVSDRYKRSLALVMLSSADRSPRSGVTELLSGRLRHSDEVLDFPDCAAVLMGETNRTGALLAVERVKSVCAGRTDLRFGVASYPEDGEAPAKLLTSARRRLELAQGQGPGAVVNAG